LFSGFYVSYFVQMAGTAFVTKTAICAYFSILSMIMSIFSILSIMAPYFIHLQALAVFLKQKILFEF